MTGAVIEFPCAEPRLARYVTVDIDDTRPEVTQAVLMMAEVTIKIIPALQQGKNSHRLSNVMNSRHLCKNCASKEM